jgi:hypothetical protein
MNVRVSEKLNQLLRESAPIKEAATEGNECVRWTCALGWQYIQNVVLPVLTRHEKEAVRREIIDAAQDRRECLPWWISAMHAAPDSAKLAPTGCGRVLWEIAAEEVRAAVAADNAARLDAYETYRVACEQGVAVAPQ